MQNLDSAILNFIGECLHSTSFEVIPLAGDASSRRYFRIVQDEHSWVLMWWEPFVDDGHYPFLSVLNHFAKHQVQVPKVMHSAPHLGVILLEDLGDLTLERKFWENQDHNLTIPFYQAAIDELIKIHYPASHDRSSCTAFTISFNTERLLWEMNYGREHLLEKLAHVKLSTSHARELEELFTQVCERIDQEPKYIAHRDYHSRNLMLKLGKMRVIDFQDARLGAVQYDLVSLLKDSYVELEESIAVELIDYYLDQRKAFESKPLSRAHFDEIYELHSIQRCFKACGSFASFFNLRGDTRYLKYLPHTLQRVKASLERFPRYKLFLDILTDHGLFERKFEEP